MLFTAGLWNYEIVSVGYWAWSKNPTFIGLDVRLQLGETPVQAQPCIRVIFVFYSVVMSLASTTKSAIFHRVYSTQMRNYQQWEFTMWCWELCAQNTLPWEQKLHLTTNWVINLGSFHLISFCRPLPSRPHCANSSSVYITRLCLLLYDRLKVSILQLPYGRDNQSYVWHKQ